MCRDVGWPCFEPPILYKGELVKSEKLFQFSLLLPLTQLWAVPSGLRIKCSAELSYSGLSYSLCRIGKSVVTLLDSLSSEV